MLATLERQTTEILRPLDFELPSALEAHEPPEARGLARDQVRLLVSRRDDNSLEHGRFHELPRFLKAGDLVVVNDSVTVPAALTAVRDTHETIALHLSTQLEPNVWVVEPRKVAVHPGERLALPAGGVAEILDSHHGSTRLWRARLDLPTPWLSYLEAHGRPITYSYVESEWPIEMYRTVYGAKPGSAEMPSAGRAFSQRVIAGLEATGIGMSAITLHTGVASLEDHEPPYEEWFEVSDDTARAIAATRARGGRVVAVGTTVVRALETAAAAAGAVQPMSGWTDLIVTPVRGLQAIDALITGFHEPKASHLAMLEALASREHLTATYKAALQCGYLWHEFGDLHLIL